MIKYVKNFVQVGELVAAAFDSAAKFSKDKEEISYLATRATMLILRRARLMPILKSPLTENV